MTDRRFTDKPELYPEGVRALPAGHAALVGNRTLFPSTVVDVDAKFEGRLLVSGENNRKLGRMVAKGAFKGYALYGLSLEERATCPEDCSVRDICYGNGMQMARRHRIVDPEYFYVCLEDEIRELTTGGAGLLVRLHVLGDFPSVDYVAFWSDMLAEHATLAVYGYTHRKTKAWGGDEIGEAIQSLKDAYPDRFRIRWSSDVYREDGAMVIDETPRQPTTADGAIVCPAQTDATACCASCGLCWEPNARHASIAFIKHGPKSDEAAAAAAMRSFEVEEAESAVAIVAAAPKAKVITDAAVQPPSTPSRAVIPLSLPSSVKPAIIAGDVPKARLVRPTDLRVEPVYQRDLSAKSMKLIRKIVSGWDWAKFKPPVCAETKDGLFVIDGQHTAIAAASHPAIREIPVLVVTATHLERRAGAFVAHNRDRVAMSEFQIFHAEVAAGVDDAGNLLALAKSVGATIPRSPPRRGAAKPGDVLAVNQLRKSYRAHGASVVGRVLRIAVMARQAPLDRLVARATVMLLTLDAFKDVAKMPDSAIANGLMAVKDMQGAATAFAEESGQGRDRAAAVLIAAQCRESSKRSAA
ncbi:MAG: hypothetical protein KIS96_03655 [Bauldia sp.]|nr:hypothetical protein [Bauldia sp.]